VEEDWDPPEDNLIRLLNCPRCGKPSPEEFLSCIYCGARLPVRAGILSGLGPPQKIGLALLALLIAILILLWTAF